MAELVFDIESVAIPLSDFDEDQQEYLLKWADREETPEKQDEKREEIIRGMAFNAMTAQVAAIGLMNVESGKGRVYYVSPESESWESEDGQVSYESGTEQEILENFWRDIKAYQRFVTFNGRSFDCPFLMIRSALHNIRASRNLMPPRFDYKIHCDLLEQLTFYSATRKYNLDFYCKSFGIESPKSHGVTGDNVLELYQTGMHREIAEYCFWDVKATAELYKIWRNTLSFEKGQEHS